MQDIKLDYSIESPKERNELVKKIIAESPPEKLTNKYLEILANYIIFAMSKEEKKKKIINTDNRMVTINKRETSFEGLATKFENGQDGIYNIIANDKNIIFTPKISITQEDLQQIPGLKELKQVIKQTEKEILKASGKRKYFLKKQLIQMRQDQYVIKNSYKQPIYCLNAVKNFNIITFNEKIQVSHNGDTIKDNSIISFMNPKHVSALLCNYSKLKEQCYGRFYTDGYFLMEDLDAAIERALHDKPLYRDLLIYKIDGKQNIQIQKILKEKYNIKHSVEYISSLWRNKIPKIIAEQAVKDYLDWYYRERERGQWKTCTRCKQTKLANNIFFSKNSSSKDGFYSICKNCRNQKNKKHKKITVREE